MEQQSDNLDAFLEHYGVKGMKWGVRKDRSSKGRGSKVVLTEDGTDVTKADLKWKKQMSKLAVGVQVHNGVAKELNEQLPAFNEKYSGKDLGFNRSTGEYESPAGKKYVAEYEKLATTAASRVTKEVLGDSPSGNWTTQATYSLSEGLKVAVVDKKKLQHEDGLPTLVIPVTIGEDGRFLPIKLKEADVEHADSLEDFLEHYGVKGMKWGIRKDRDRSGSKSSGDSPAKSEGKTISDEEAAELFSKVLENNAAQAKAKYGPGSLGGSSGDDGKSLREKYNELTPEQQEQLKRYAKNAAKAAVVLGAVGYLTYKGGQAGKMHEALHANNPDEFIDFWMESNMAKMGKKGLEDLKGEAVSLSAGDILQRVSTEKESIIRPGGFFASFEPDDVTRYKAALPNYWPQWGIVRNPPSGHVVQIRAKQAVKAPSEREAYTLWKDFMKSYKPGVTDQQLTPNDFYQASMRWSGQGDRESQQFFGYIKRKGYNALIDTNDAGSLGKRPLRLLDSDMFEIAGHEKLSYDGIMSARKNVKALAHAIAMLLGLTTSEEFLEHYGVKGMKWGVRRSPKQLAKARAAARVKAMEAQGKTGYVEKGVKLTESELTARIKRMETEKRYNELNSRTVTEGEKIAREILTNVGKKTATIALTAVAIVSIKPAIEAKFGPEAANMIRLPKK